MAKILVVCDTLNDQFKTISGEVLTGAQKIAAEQQAEVAALLVGGAVASHADAVSRYGVSKIYTVEDANLAQYSPDSYAAAIAEAVRQTQGDVVLMGANYTGKDLLSRVSQILDAGLAQDCINYHVEGGELRFVRPMYAGKVWATVKISSTPALATFRAKAFKAEEKPVSAQVEALSVTVPAPLAVLEEFQPSSTGKIDVTEADLIVSGGRGLRGPENWHLIEDLAEAMGAATGCSRPVSDEGWRPHDEHIGQTGKTVAPDLYVACGISGAIQHIAGISSSKFIVAINKDPEAPIFKVADYGIVGDVFDVLPAMTEEIKKLKSQG